ncbi:MAG: TolC family protein, partial [Polyangia bacterium]|nr:TolC family protein [Polyangia bacterium]
MRRARLNGHILTPGLVLAVLAWSGQARGQAMSQEAAVGRALGRHPLIEAAGQGARAADARVKQAQTGWLPRIRIEGGYQYAGPQQRLSMTVQPSILPDPIEINREIGTVHNASVGVSVAWRVYDFGARDVTTKAARAAAAAARAQGKEREAELAYAVRAAYLAALFFEEVERVTERSLGVARREEAEEKLKRKAGLGSDLDLARVATRVAQLEARLTEARQERGRAMTALGLLLGLGAASGLRLTDSLEGLAAAPAGPGPKRHPTRLRLEALKEASEHQLSAQWRSYFPTLDLMASLKYQYPKNYFENDRAGLF